MFFDVENISEAEWSAVFVNNGKNHSNSRKVEKLKRPRGRRSSETMIENQIITAGGCSRGADRDTYKHVLTDTRQSQTHTPASN